MDNFIFYPIHDIIEDSKGNGLILGKNGSLTYVISLTLPEVYSLSDEDIVKRHSVFKLAFSHMPDNSYVHKQDVFRVCKYQYPDGVPGEQLTYLAQADRDHFTGREYLEHTCVIGFTLAGLESLSEAYTQNIFSYKENLHKEDSDRIMNFLSAIEFTINHISSLRIPVKYLTGGELKEYIFSSANFYSTGDIKDIHFSESITAGNIKAQMYAITDEEGLPDEVQVVSKDETASTVMSKLYMSMAESFGGIHLNYNHVYNQVFYFYSDKKLKGTLSKNLHDHQVNEGWDGPNMRVKIKKLEKLSTEIAENNESLCYAHYSVMLWNDNQERLDLAIHDFNERMNLCNIKYYIPSYGNLADIYGGGIVGCTASLKRQYMFISSLSVATAFLSHYSGFQDDKEGIYFNDRLTQKPIVKDIWDAKKKRINARNAVVVSPTGGGKSFLANHIMQQLLDQGVTVVAVEFGNSFKQLCNLYPDKSIHIEYDQNKPLGINPFNLHGRELTPEKEETLVNLCLRFWGNTETTKEEITSLRKFIVQYYKNNECGHSFQNFYRFLVDGFDELCTTCGINSEFFRIDSFKHVCSEFMPGGSYENLCVDDGIASDLTTKQFIHFELTKIKSDPFVSSIVISLLFDVINNTILSDPSRRGYIIFDEYAETAQMKTTNSLDVNIHQAVAFFYQKIRKENGAVMTIIQSPVQLPRDEFTDGMIANTQLLFVLQGSEVVHRAIIDTFKITNQAHQNQMYSVKNNYTAKRPYSECWIRFGEGYALTARLEASPRKYLAFQTEGETRSALDKLYESNGHDMRQAIEEHYQSITKN
ncbi:conjugal transfer protein [Bacteroides sp. 51]|uniref:TraG/VirB4 family ATPase n=1 Tax=Bacteroides sp. 51 TaxID=2302938 RepID=UPI0013D4D847|nr:conjugal transfer protein [Bacteroides sp. 51]NDV83436.1 conjugal transfer protein [Bacteroides sp. 51]